MKKNHIAKGLGIAALSLALASCTSGFEEANRPGGSQSKEVLQRDNYNISSFLVQLQNVAFPEQENAYQCNFDLVGNYLGRYFTYANNGWSSKKSQASLVRKTSTTTGHSSCVLTPSLL